MDIAQPISFESAYGAGSRRALCLGGRGIFFVAWQVGYLSALMEEGVDIRGADRIVGTSAGSIVAIVLARESLHRLRAELSILSRFPQAAAKVAPSGRMHPSQSRAWEVFEKTTSSEPTSMQRVGHAALAAQTVDPVTMQRNIELVAGIGDWPTDSVFITCNDTFSGDRCVVSHRSGTSPTHAMAASTALPGMFPPQQVLDRKCMDGGVGSTAVHLDLVAGAGTALVLSLRGFGDQPATARDARDLARLKQSGTRIFTAVPDSFRNSQMMDPNSIPTARDMGQRQGAADAPAIQELWG